MFNVNHELNAFLAARDYLLRSGGEQSLAAQEFRWPVLRHFNWSLDYFDFMARENHNTALKIVDDGGLVHQQTFQELSRRSSQVANFFERIGVRRGDRILLMLGNEVALWECMLGAFKLGAIVIPATTLLTAQDLRDRIRRGRVGHVIAAGSVLSKFDTVPGNYTRVRVGPGDPAWSDLGESAHQDTAFQARGPTAASDPMLLYFTSGTTSSPKLVLHTHQSYPVGHLSTMFWLGLKPGDVHLNVSSPGWAKHAWSSCFAPWNAGACVFVCNMSRFDAVKLLDVLAEHTVTTLCAPPTVWRMLIQEDLGQYRNRIKLRELAAAGEPLNPEILSQVRSAWGLTVRDGYGQTETTALIGNAPDQPIKPGSMGRPLPGYDVVLLNADGERSSEGEVCLKLDSQPLGLMAHYEDAAEKTGEAFRGGLYHTGDVATRDADGYIVFVGRTDDVFKSSDYRISPFELESALLEHEAVAEVAVVASPDAIRMAVPKAFITLVKGVSADPRVAFEILSFARRRLAPYKRVRRLEFVRELPKTISGKLRRTELRGIEAERRQHASRAEAEYFEEDFPNLK